MKKIACSTFALVFLLALFSLSSCAKKSAASSDSSPVYPTGADPLYPFQWHLKNVGQLGGKPGIDINVEGAWNQGITGEGVLTLVVDDGVDLKHEDLVQNANLTYSKNYLSDGLASNNPGPSGNTAMHGTCVAGLIAARDSNAAGGRGSAPRASISGRNVVAENSPTTLDIADALSSGMTNIAVVNNSWGPTDGIGQYAAIDSPTSSAIQTGLRTGRGGLGTVYVWAGGNGEANNVDNSNYDGFANFYPVISVGAVGDDGTRAYYAEKGANLWVVAPSQGLTGSAITTTDLVGDGGFNTSQDAGDYPNKSYTKFFNGTSAAAPIVAGVVALMIQANSQLSWRDVRIILAKTAVKVDSSNSDWTTNAAGYNINHNYGFGLVDATAAVNLAKKFTTVGKDIDMKVVSMPLAGPQGVNQTIPDNDPKGLSDTMVVSGSGVNNIETVVITALVNHPDWGNLEFTLTRSGNSTTSAQLSYAHTCYTSYPSAPSTCTVSSNSWNFSTPRFIDEAADGSWTLTVKDRITGNVGMLLGWRLTFYGR